MSEKLRIDPSLLAEIELLLRYELGSRQHGIKLRSDAEASLLQAAQRLFDKGLVTEPHGGYLTDEGFRVAEHLQSAYVVLSSPAQLPRASHELIE